MVPLAEAKSLSYLIHRVGFELGSGLLVFLANKAYSRQASRVYLRQE